MPISLLLLTTIILFLIARQDFASRAVSWFLFPSLAACGAALAWSELRSPASVLIHVAFNAGFLLLQLTLLKFWLIWRNQKRRLFGYAIGVGDLLFLLAAGCFFSPVNFIVFYLASLLFALALHFIMRRWPRLYGQHTNIPLAGLQAGFLILVLTLCDIIRQPITSDLWTIPN